MRVTVRLFAAAREAVGSPEKTVEVPDGATVADALRTLDPDGTAGPVLDRCSVLLDAVAEDRDAVVHDGSTIDVLPPFAGGWSVAMHADEVRIDLDTAQRLIAEQFPDWAALPVTPIESAGTVNAIVRIGDALTARFPLQGSDPAGVAAHLRAEASSMTEFAQHCTVLTPTPVALGGPGEGYPLPWSVQTWVPGTVATPGGVAASAEFAADLAELIHGLRRADARGRRFSGSGRGGAVADHDAWVAECLRRSESLLDTDPIRRIWERLRVVPRSGPDVMSHGDLIPANLLVAGERLAGVLDAGGFGPADPALDLVCAWHLLAGDARAVLRAQLDSGERDWLRGAAWALEQALGLVWYYEATNPLMSELGRSTLARIVADPEVGG